MKSNLGRLLKIEFLRTLSSFTRSGKKLRQTPILYVLIGVVFFSVLMSFGYSVLIMLPFIQEGSDPAPATTMFASFATILIFMSALRQARGIYIGEDYDMLTALPIRKRDIVASKVIGLYLVELAGSFLIMIPHAIVAIAFGHNLMLFWASLILAFALPIFPLTVAVFLALFVTMATARFKSANMIFAILSTVFIVAFSAMTMVLNNMGQTESVSGFVNVGNALKWLNPTYVFMEMGLQSNPLYWLLFVGINAALAVITVSFLALCFDKLHDIVTAVSMKKTYVRKELKNKTQGKALLSLEFKRVVNSKIYFMNSLLGAIMGILGCTIFLYRFADGFKNAGPDAIWAKDAFALPIFIVTACMIMGLSNPTTGAINIEGKNFWLTKSLPIDYRKYIRAKLYFAWIMTLPGALIASALTLIWFRDSPYQTVFAFILPILYLVMNSLIGLIVAIKHPKLKWNSEAEAVKNSAAVVISMLINLGTSMAVGTLLIPIAAIVPQFAWIGYVLTTVAIGVTILVCALYLRKHFSKAVDAIEDL